MFLQDGFAMICAKNSICLMKKKPEESIIDLLVQQSSGLYATTVLKFVGARFCNPTKVTKQIALELESDPRTSAFSDLDKL